MISPAEYAHYAELALEDKKRYRREMAAYKREQERVKVGHAPTIMLEGKDTLLEPLPAFEGLSDAHKWPTQHLPVHIAAITPLTTLRAPSMPNPHGDYHVEDPELLDCLARQLTNAEIDLIMDCFA